jgi:prefoldin subunit 5
MSHFYLRKSYSFAESDEKMLDIRKEMSNFLTKEEAMDLLNKRNVIIDPSPHYQNHEIDKLHERIHDLERQLQSAFIEIDKLKNAKKHFSP